jgi:type I thyroxine 5'-deiodinase
MAERYRDRASFRTIYIKEAHAEDEWQMDDNVDEGVCYAQPRTFEDRLRIARDFVARFDYGIPLWVDDIDDAAKKLYSGWPERLYVVDADGRIAYKGDPGPFGFHPEEVDAWLAAHPPAASTGAPSTPR